MPGEPPEPAELTDAQRDLLKRISGWRWRLFRLHLRLMSVKTRVRTYFARRSV